MEPGKPIYKKPGSLREVMEDLSRIRWAKVTEGLLKVEVWAEQDLLAAIPK